MEKPHRYEVGILHVLKQTLVVSATTAEDKDNANKLIEEAGLK